MTRQKPLKSHHFAPFINERCLNTIFMLNVVSWISPCNGNDMESRCEYKILTTLATVLSDFFYCHRKVAIMCNAVVLFMFYWGNPLFNIPKMYNSPRSNSTLSRMTPQIRPPVLRAPDCNSDKNVIS